MSFVQWAVILALNVALMLKLRTIWTRQRKLKEAMSNYPRRPAQERRFSLASVGTISHLIFRPPDVSKEAATPAPHLDHAALHKARRGYTHKKTGSKIKFSKTPTLTKVATGKSARKADPVA